MNEALHDALVAARSGNREKARVMLAEYLRADPENVPAWVLLSKLANSPVQKAAFLRKVLDIDPDHAYARQALEELGQAPAPVVRSDAEPATAEAETDSGEPHVPQPTPAPKSDRDEEYATMEEIVEPLEDEWPVSDEPADYEEQAAAETIPPWMQAAETDETTIEREASERIPRPSFPEETAREEEERPPWPRDDEAARAAPEMQTTADADEAAASEKAARLSQAMAQQAPTVVETEAETDRGWMLPLLIVVAAVIFLLLVYAVFTYLL